MLFKCSGKYIDIDFILKITYLSSIKTELVINFLKKKLLYLAKNRAGTERVKLFIY